MLDRAEECIHNSETDINDLQAQSIVLDRTISLFYQLKLNYGIEYCYNRLAIQIRPKGIRSDFCNCLFRDSCNKSRHSLITLHISKNKNPRGPGFWKLNTSFLFDLEYINLIKKTVKEISEEYENNDEVNAALLWNTMKMKIRSSSLHSKIKD